MKTLKCYFYRSFLAIGLLLSSATANAMSVDYSSGPGLGLAINDFSITEHTINVADHGILNNLTLEIGLNHTFVGDLTLFLEAPDSTTILLTNQPTGGPAADLDDNFHIFFMDSAATPAADAGAGCGATDIIGNACLGSFVPETSLSILNGVDVFGDWTLSIADFVLFDVGNLDSWTLHTDITAVPLPPAVWLMLSALVLLNVFKRKPTAALSLS